MAGRLPGVCSEPVYLRRRRCSTRGHMSCGCGFFGVVNSPSLRVAAVTGARSQTGARLDPGPRGQGFAETSVNSVAAPCCGKSGALNRAVRLCPCLTRGDRLSMWRGSWRAPTRRPRSRAEGARRPISRGSRPGGRIQGTGSPIASGKTMRSRHSRPRPSDRMDRPAGEQGSRGSFAVDHEGGYRPIARAGVRPVRGSTREPQVGRGPARREGLTASAPSSTSGSTGPSTGWMAAGGSANVRLIQRSWEAVAFSGIIKRGTTFGSGSATQKVEDAASFVPAGVQARLLFFPQISKAAAGAERYQGRAAHRSAIRGKSNFNPFAESRSGRRQGIALITPGEPAQGLRPFSNTFRPGTVTSTPRAH